LLKKGYKIIIIKDGQFDLKQFNLNRFTVSVILSLIPIPFILFYFTINFFNTNSIANKNELINTQKDQINELQIDNASKSKKLTNYERDIEKKISENQKKLNNLNNQLIGNQKKSDKIVKTLFETDGLPRETRKAGSGGETPIKEDKSFDNSNLDILYDKSTLVSNQINHLQKQINIESIYLDNIETKFYSNLDYWLSIPSRMPMDIKRGIYISSYYGYRNDPLHNRNQFHSGDDFSATIGTPVKCTGDGVVLKAEFDHRLGNFVEIDHGYGYKTVYGHMLGDLPVKKGDKVTRGQTIGKVGNSGRSTAPHLHYEVKYDNKTENPRKFYTYDKKLEKLIYNP
tara:strand:+ start:169 stop:1194 length:1026 start_codon:yes stop_codon:yes gene_type:complete